MVRPCPAHYVSVTKKGFFELAISFYFILPKITFLKILNYFVNWYCKALNYSCAMKSIILPFNCIKNANLMLNVVFIGKSLRIVSLSAFDGYLNWSERDSYDKP